MNSLPAPAACAGIGALSSDDIVLRGACLPVVVTRQTCRQEAILQSFQMGGVYHFVNLSSLM